MLEPVPQSTRITTRAMQKKVVILGGGVAGLSAAHELIERGFAVEVYEERLIPGGKARSVSYPYGGPEASTSEGKDLPGEHGFRFFPRFYKHVIDTMQRIPYEGDKAVSDNLVGTTRVEWARFDRSPIVLPSRFPRSLGDVKVILDDFPSFIDEALGISHEEMAFFASCIWRILTSCEERRLDEYEKIGWWDFIKAGEHSQPYRKYFGHGFTRSLVAAKAELASTKTVGDIHIQLLFDVLEPGPSSDRVLNGPTNDVWISPWLRHLTALGVKYHLGATATSIRCSDGLIKGVTIEKDGNAFEVQGDYYICALPVEDMAVLLTQDILDADPALAGIQQLARDSIAWMVGLQLYLTEDVPITHGHTIYIDSPWALTSISQAQFWPDVDLAQYADGKIRGIISVDISEWDAKGLNGKTARDCTWEEIKAEVWEQLKRSLNVGGVEVLKDSYLHAWYTEPDVYRTAGGRLRNEEPLLVNYINTWSLRPEAVTRIQNLFLASDYVRTYTDVATMEGANEAARRAVNGILDASGANAERCKLWKLHEPAIFAPWRAIDRVRYLRGLPWDDTLVNLGLSALGVSREVIALLGKKLLAGGESFNWSSAELAANLERWVAPLGQSGSRMPGEGDLRESILTLVQNSVPAIAALLAEAQRAPVAGADATRTRRNPRTAADGIEPPAKARVPSGRVRIIPQ